MIPGPPGRSAFLEILTADRPGDALRQWKGALPVFLDLAGDIPAGPRPWHTGSLLDHLARCMNEVAGDPLAVWLALAHDAGKLTTPAALLPHHYGHELRGERLAAVWARQLALDADWARAGILAAGWHMRAARYNLLRPGKKYRLLATIQPRPCAGAFWKLVDADTKSRLSLAAARDWQLLRKAAEEGLPEQRQIGLLRRQKPA